MTTPLNRRDFVKQTTAAVALACVSSRTAYGKDFDPDFCDATDALAAIARKEISSVEVVERTFQRIATHNPQINAFVTLLEEAALARAREADAALAKGETWGPLHGLPILVKDAYETAGVRTTCGAEELADYVPEKNAVAVDRLLKAGAIMIGKSNVPKFCVDMQTSNKIAGRTNNPWNLERTPGASTGGGAAALAAGIGYLEIGSDIGGSIRNPAHFCGLYGLKPTLNVVPVDGHIPPPPGQTEALVELPVCGPLARSARDLRLELNVIGGPDSLYSTAYSWRLPKPRHKQLRDYRIGYVLDDPFCTVTTEVRSVLEDAINKLSDAGCNLTNGWPADVNPTESHETYVQLLAATFSPTATDAERQSLASLPEDHLSYPLAENWEKGISFSHVEWLKIAPNRLVQRNRWAKWFQDFDVFLTPTNFVTAFPHDPSPSQLHRVIKTSAGDRSFTDLLSWISFATLTGNPAVVAPVGLASDGLPVGMEIMGPFLEDDTAIHFAELIAPITGAFQPPPDFV